MPTGVGAVCIHTVPVSPKEINKCVFERMVNVEDPLKPYPHPILINTTKVKLLSQSPWSG